MLEESKVNPTAIDSETVVLPSVKESFSSLPSSGEVRARIAAVRKVIVNYETYIAYQIVTLANRGDYPSGICVVERRYREFDWLYSRFLSIYAVLFVPPLPGKKVLSQFNRYDSSFVDRRCSGLQTFLHKSASHRILSSNPDFIAFLTLSNNDFQRYKQRYPTESSLISSLIGYSPQVLSSDAYIGTADISEQQVVDAITTTLPSNSPPQSSNPVIIPSTREVSSPQHLRQASEKFSCYQIEAMEYTALCQSLSSLLDRMTTQLATLSYDHAELAKTLEQAGQSTVVAASASTTNSEDGWASSLVGSAMRRTAQATHALASRLSDDSARPWHENAAFGEAVKRVLKNRQTIQDIYFSLDQEVKERRRLEGDGSEDVVFQHPQAPASTDTTAVLTSDTQVNSTSYKWLARFASMPWRSNSKRRKNIPISELETKLKSACCDLVFANSQVEAEWHRWESERVKETAEALSTLSSAYVAYWSSLAESWRDVNALLNNPPQSTNASGNVVETDLLLESTSVDATPTATELTKDSLLKSNSVEITSCHGCSPNVPDLSSLSKDTGRNLEDQKEREWTVVDLSDSPCVEKKLESTAIESD